MKPDLSEFSYGFALTNELVGWTALRTAPMFPSLIEEGRAGGGYDVKLDRPGVPLFLQFKRSECIGRTSGREHRAVLAVKGRLDVPYHRFDLMASEASDQHEMLPALDDGSNEVFYAAPRFHRVTQLDAAWRRRLVAAETAFFAPRQIGPVDPGLHRVAFDERRSWLCSDPKAIDALTASDLQVRLSGLLAERAEPLQETLRRLPSALEEAERSGREKARNRRAMADRSDDGIVGYELRRETGARSITGEATDETSRPPEGPPPRIRTPDPLEDINAEALRSVAEHALRAFGSQLMIVQNRSEADG